jgi:hypothetical protein
VIVIVDVAVIVSAPVIVAALVNGNDTVEVIDTVDIEIDQLDHDRQSRSSISIPRA